MSDGLPVDGHAAVCGTTLRIARLLHISLGNIHRKHVLRERHEMRGKRRGDGCRLS